MRNNQPDYTTDEMMRRKPYNIRIRIGTLAKLKTMAKEQRRTMPEVLAILIDEAYSKG